jgi:hypothetical protein
MAVIQFPVNLEATEIVSVRRLRNLSISMHDKRLWRRTCPICLVTFKKVTIRPKPLDRFDQGKTEMVMM